MSLADARLLARCHRFTELAAIGLVLAGATVLAGWALDIEVLRSLIPGLIAMNPATAVAFMLAGVALLRLFRKGQTRHSSLALACALLMVLIGASRLLAYVSPLNVSLDEVLFSDRLDGNHMAPNTAFNFIVDGLALALVSLGAGVALAQLMVMLAAAVAFLALLGYLFHVPLFGLPGYIPMALSTALCFLLAELALVAGTADKGYAAALVSRLSGGRAARRLLGPAVLLPLVLGWLGTAGARRGWFAPEFAVALVVMLSILGSALLILLSAGRLNHGDAEIERLLTIDPLTGLLNRRTVMEALGSETAAALRYRMPLATAMVDIDHFKAINDAHGHAVGDEVLCTLGGLIRSTLRETDVAGRYGGEEFVVVLPHTDQQGALVFGERLRQRIAEAVIPLRSGERLTVTCSIGISQVQVSEQPQPEVALASADQALYRAKREGRNRVQVAAVKAV